MKINGFFKQSGQLIIRVITIGFFLQSVAMANNRELTAARNLFYLSVEDQKHLDSAIVSFQSLSRLSQIDSGLATTYIGALHSLKGKHAFWPREKLRWVNQGLKMMDEGILQSPDNIEARFIRGTTCFYLPFFFKRQETAQADFKQIIILLPEDYINYDAKLILNVIDFLEKNAQLTAMERNQIVNIKNSLKLNAF